jgi:flagellar protein FlaJ
MSFRAAYDHRNLVYGASLGSAFVVDIVLAILSLLGRVNLPFSIPTTLILVTLVFLVYPIFMEFAYQRWKRRIDDAVPAMLSDITANVKTGMNLDRALEMSADRDYGPLSVEVAKLKTQMQLGMPFEEAVSRLINRVKTAMVTRTFGLLVQANRAGGRIENLLDVIQSDANELFLLEKERRSAIRPYVVVIYIAWAVFLAVSVLLVDTFFKAVIGSATASSGPGSSFFQGLQGLSIATMKDLFLQMSLIESIFGGFGAGKLGEGSFVAGFKHVLIMSAVTLMVFVFGT